MLHSSQDTDKGSARQGLCQTRAVPDDISAKLQLNLDLCQVQCRCVAILHNKYLSKSATQATVLVRDIEDEHNGVCRASY